MTWARRIFKAGRGHGEQLVGREAKMGESMAASDRGVRIMAVRRIFRVSDLGKVGPVEGLDPSTVLAVSAVGGGHVGWRASRFDR